MILALTLLGVMHWQPACADLDYDCFLNPPAGDWVIVAEEWHEPDPLGATNPE